MVIKNRVVKILPQGKAKETLCVLTFTDDRDSLKSILFAKNRTGSFFAFISERWWKFKKIKLSD